MMWQMWTAFGIMLGYVADLAFYKVPDKPHIKGLNWRLMLASVRTPAPSLPHPMPIIFYRLASPHYSSWRKSSSAPNHLVGSSPRVDTRKRISRWRGSAVTLSRRPAIFIVSLFFPVLVAAGSHPSSDIHVLLETEKELTRGRNRYLELFTVPRNRRAALGSFVVMFM